MPLEQAVASCMTDELPAELFEVPALSADACEDRTRRSVDRLENVVAQAGELRALYDRAIRLIRKVIRENKRNRAADRVVEKVLRIKEQLKDYQLLYVLMTHVAQSDLFIRLRRDRELDGGEQSGVEKQRKQAERDLEYLLGLKHAVEFFTGELERHEFLSAEAQG